MKRQMFAASFALAVLAGVGIAANVAAKEHVPFKGKLEGYVTITPLDPPYVQVAVDATGNATHLGQFTVSIPHVVNRANRTAIGTYEFVAANGDTLTADFTGASMLSDISGVLAIVETATITGGTGRFAGATGGFRCERLFDTVNLTTIGSFKGTVSSPGASKR